MGTRFAILIIFSTIAIGIVFAVVKLLFGTLGNGDSGSLVGAGQDAGIYVSSDAGRTFTHSAQAESVSFARFDVLAIAEDIQAPGTWWIATKGAGVYRSSDQAKSWQAIWGDGAILQKAVVRGIGQLKSDGMLFALDQGGRGRIWKTQDAGTTFREVYSAATEGVTVQTLAVPFQEPRIVIAGLSDGLLIGSTDAGETWKSLTQFSGPLRKVAFSPSNTNVAYAAVDRLGLFRSDDRGATWHNLGQGTFQFQQSESAERPLSSFPRGKDILDFSIHPQDHQQILVATAAGLLLSRDAGGLYKPLPIPLKANALAVQAVSYDPLTPETIYAVTSDGFYASNNGGESWNVARFQIQPKLAEVEVSRADNNVILVGTAD